MIGHLFTVLIAQPIFNLLVLIYALIPGHNFGLAIIIFTIIVRLALWPLLKKQLHQTKVMRKLQPELKRIKQETKGDKLRENQMVMELYKERGVNPFGSIGIVLVQLPILIALYSGLRKVIDDPQQILSFAYPALQHLPWMEELAHDVHKFDATLFGVVDLTKSAVGAGSTYWPAMIIVLASAVVQYYQSKQLLPTEKDSRKLRDIMRDAGNGKQADQTEVNAAIGRSTRFLLPVMIFFFTVGLASALSLYWFVSGLVAYIQQSIILREDEEEMEAIADAPSKKDLSKIPEAEVVASGAAAKASTTPKKTTKKRPASKSKKRRKK